MNPPRTGLTGAIVVLVLLGICVLVTKVANRLTEANIKRKGDPQ